MSAFKNPNFVAEFAYRTQWNYYMLRSLQETNSEKKENIEKQINHVEGEMRRRGYIIADFYEITQLINSLIGLLVFPEQAGYDYISNEPEFFEDMFPLLDQYINKGKGYYYNSYRVKVKKTPFTEWPAEPPSPKNIIRHLRNAAAHKEMGILPVNGEIAEGKQEIKEIYFKDRNTKEAEEQLFELKVNVDDLEPLLLEISNVLLSQI